MKKKSNFSLKSKYVLLILTFLCIGLIFVTLSTQSASGPMKTAAGYSIVPIQNGINKIGTWFGGLKNNFQDMQKLTKKNKELQAKLDDMTVENSRLQQDKYELQRLQDLYKLDQKYEKYHKVGARVIATDAGNWFSTFIIDKGKKDGIKVDMNVIAGSGLVGIVTEVGPNWSSVRSIIDDSSNVSAMLLSTSDRCMIRGDLKLMNEGSIRLEQLDNNDHKVKVGEQVVTSHISPKYLEGLVIGYVNKISVDANNLTRSGYVTPVVDFKHLQEVLVITDLKETPKTKKADKNKEN